jgi:hypothetical protein
MAMYTFFTHGVATVVEFPGRCSKIQHAGWGTLIEQGQSAPGIGWGFEPWGPSGPSLPASLPVFADLYENWFHLPITTPTGLIETGAGNWKDVRVLGVSLSIWKNQNAIIDRIDVRSGADLVFSMAGDLAFNRFTPPLSPTYYGDIRLQFPFSPPLASGGNIWGEGLVICTKVRFVPGGVTPQIIFKGAGGLFETFYP